MKRALRSLPVVALLFAGSTQAQRITASLLGDVTDNTGAAVAGAKVVAKNVDTNTERSAETDERGAYRIDFVPIGRYDISIERT